MNKKHFNTYETKPGIKIQAAQWDGTNEHAKALNLKSRHCDSSEEEWGCDTLEGFMTAKKSDYIILGTEGEIYPCKESVFNKKYRIQQSEPIMETHAYIYGYPIGHNTPVLMDSFNDKNYIIEFQNNGYIIVWCGCKNVGTYSLDKCFAKIKVKEKTNACTP